MKGFYRVLKDIVKFFTSRLFLLSLVIVFMFSICAKRLFELQIIRGEEIQNSLKVTSRKKITLPAPRGNIYDRNGRPLAINKVAYSVKIDNSILLKDEERNDMLLNLIHILEDNDEEIIDDLPISSSMPYSFLFNNNADKELRWKKDLDVPKDKYSMNAEETFDFLLDLFKVNKDLPFAQQRKLVGLRYMIYQKRWRKYEPVIVSLDIADKTLMILEEENQKFPGVYIDVDSLRFYPERELFSHIIGYTHLIGPEMLNLYSDYGYTRDDIVGQLGIEKSMELELKGSDGEIMVEVDTTGRRVSTEQPEDSKQPVPGNNVFLTIDANLQRKTTEILESALRDVLIAKLDPVSSKDTSISLKQFFISMVNGNNISLEKIWYSYEVDVQHSLKRVLEADFSEYYRVKLTEDIQNYNSSSKDTDLIKEAKQIICDAIENDVVSLRDMVFILDEQGIVIIDDSTREQLENNLISPLSFIKQALLDGSLSPALTNLDPCTGAVAVVDVKTGEALSLVTYPSYDNNELVNNFNEAYYYKLLKDPSTPLINRPLMQRKAPGSTLKMLSAFAGLENGVISPTGTISDLGIFTKAGSPPARCWIYTSSHSTHGAVNVSKAIEVSCNYFFYEMSHRLGNSSAGTRLDGIAALNEYMRSFGLDSYTGVEIEESKPEIASPEYKETLIKRFQNPDATPSQTRWSDGDTIRAAIGQSYNNFAAAHMAKYIATVANSGTRLRMNIVDKIVGFDGSLIEQTLPYVEEDIDLDPANVAAVHKGMLDVTTGSQGTIRRVFENSTVTVAGKTGTAQEAENRPNHTWFVCFAPYDDPLISVAVMIPFGESSLSPAAVVAKKIVEEYMGVDVKQDVISMDNVLLQ